MSFKITFVASERTLQSFHGCILIIKNKYCSPFFSKSFFKSISGSLRFRQFTKGDCLDKPFRVYIMGFPESCVGVRASKTIKIRIFRLEKFFFGTRTPLELARYDCQVIRMPRCRDFAYKYRRFSRQSATEVIS